MLSSALHHIESKLNRFFIRILNILVGFGLIGFFLLVLLPTFYDIDEYVHNKFEYVVGNIEEATDIRTIKRVGLWQNIEINGIRLKNMNILSAEDMKKILFVEYLPNSKYVTNIWVKQTE